ncbi:MAG: AraC family transcriptional regulator [Planctomycetota bacterium]|nr:AraC family transcriptional regulator [Planctomycetota bacterium]
MGDQERYDRLLSDFNVRLLTSRLLAAGPGWNGLSLRSSFWRLYVNNRSGAGVRVNGKAHPLTPGKVHLVPAWVACQTWLTRKVDHFYMHFDFVGLPAPLVQDLFPEPRALPLDAGGRMLVEDWTADLRPPERRELPAACRALALLHWTVARLMAGLSPDAQRRVSHYYAGSAAVLPALEHIERNLAGPLENPELAARCHLSVDHFIRLFRRFTGQSPAQYVIDARVKRAAQELFFSEDSIETVAARTGFRDRFYFTRVFARRMGLAPAAYRRANRV